MLAPAAVRQVQVKKNVPVRIITTSTAASPSAMSTPAVVASIVSTPPQHTMVTAAPHTNGVVSFTSAPSGEITANNKMAISKLKSQAKPKERRSSHNVIEKRLVD